MDEKHAVNFLLYSHFGIDLDSDKEELIGAAIWRAYRDASSHVLSLNGDDTDKYIAKKSTIENIIKPELDKLKEFESYNDWHKNLCETLLDSEISKKANSDNRSLTIGIAQKWINMTMKYLFMLKSIFDQYGGCNHQPLDDLLDNDIEQNLHVPIDSYILEAANETFDISPPENSHGSAAWSKYDDYENYARWQKNLKAHIAADTSTDTSPLGWENKNWIETAKKHRETEKARLENRAQKRQEKN